MVKQSTKKSKLRTGTRQIACVWWKKGNTGQWQFNQPMVAGRWSPRFQHSNLHSLAFTLTELLVAIAILSIMFTLLFIPMTQAFDNARRGRVMAELQNAADYALEIMIRELTQATEVMPQERVDSNNQSLNLLDDLDIGDDDTYLRVDFVVRAVQGDRLLPQNWKQAYTVITYYLRRTDPSRGFQYLEIGGQPTNRRQIFRAQWIPDQNIAPEPNQRDPQGRWIVNGVWIMRDLSQLQPANPPQGGLISHNALTPPDIDVADLRFTVERRPESDERARKPFAVVIELTLRKPTPGARAKRDPNTGALMDEPDAPSLFIRRRVKVVLENVP